MNNRIASSREALRGALQLRRTLCIAREDAVNVFDIATAIGIDVLFVDQPSLEGMFLRDPTPTIILPSPKHRPRGRIAFSCAHEIGHFCLGHGTQVDEYIDGDPERISRSDEEHAADTFGAHLLMPRQAVLSRFQAHTWEVETAQPWQMFIVASELGVGYTSLVKHICRGLELGSLAWQKPFLTVSPKTIREKLFGLTTAKRVVPLSITWPKLPIDIELSDRIAIPANTPLSFRHPITDHGSNGDWRQLSVARQSESSLTLNGRPIVVRCSRDGYVGRLKYRYLTDPEDE